MLVLSCDDGGSRLPRTTRAYRSTPCWFTAPKDVRVVCGTVTVPESPESTEDVTLAIARFLSDSPDVPPDPVVFLTGGPGQDAATIAATAYEELRGAVGDRDLVAIDQRGTGKSSPSLACVELYAPKYIGDPLGAFGACRARIASNGHDVAAFHTSLVASDVEAARIAMGYPAWNLLGFSYGTRLALTIARDHPEGVRSLVLSSVVPLEADILGDVPANAERAFDHVFATCAADAACDANHPSLEARFRTAVAELDATPGTGTYGTTYVFDGGDVMTLVFDVLYDSSSLPYVPELMESAIDGNLDPYASIAAQLDRPAARISEGMHLSVQCADELPFSAAGGAPDPSVDPLYANVFASSLDEACTVWNVPASPSIENDPVTSDVPTLAIAGAFDPITPPSYAEQVVAALAHATLVVFPNGAHSIGLSDACSRSMIASFFAAESVDPATSACASTAFPLVYRSHRGPFYDGPLDEAAIARIVDALRRPRL